MATITIRQRGTSNIKTIKCQVSEVGKLRRLYQAAGYGVLSVN
jgi:hypothetical protein